MIDDVKRFFVCLPKKTDAKDKKIEFLIRVVQNHRGKKKGAISRLFTKLKQKE